MTRVTIGHANVRSCLIIVIGYQIIGFQLSVAYESLGSLGR